MTALLNTRILASLAMIVFVGAIVASSTGAFFSDTETSTGNTFTAGAIDLKIDNSSYGFDWNRPDAVNPNGVWGQNGANSWQLSDLTGQLFFSFEDLKPGDYGEDTISIHVQNDAWACMAMDLTGTPDNGINDPEADAGDITDGNGGELQNYLNFAFWNDDGDNVYENDEGPLLFQGLASALDGTWQKIADSSGGGPLTANTMQNPEYIGKFWCFGALTATPVAPSNYGAPTAAITGFSCDGAGDHNVAQTDGIVVDVHFHAVQSRNNSAFLCSSLPAPVPTEGRAVGAVLADYVAPSGGACNARVGSENFPTIQAAIDDANTVAGETICVDPGTYSEIVNVNKSVHIAGAGAATTLQNGGFIIDADNVRITGFEVTGGNTEGTFAGFYIKSGVSGLDINYNDINGPAANDNVTAGGSRGIVNVIGGVLSDLDVEHNIIREWTTGIYMNPHAAATEIWRVRFNDIDDNLAGIGQLNSALVVANEFNNVVAGSEAIGADSAYVGGEVSNNNFLSGTKLNTYGAVVPDVDAENNFWGPNGGAAQTGADVDFTPEAGVVFPHDS